MLSVREMERKKERKKERRRKIEGERQRGRERERKSEGERETEEEIKFNNRLEYFRTKEALKISRIMGILPMLASSASWLLVRRS
jgi:hypothetical protein